MSKLDWVRRKVNAVRVRVHEMRAAAIHDAIVSDPTADIPLRGLTREQKAVARFALERRRHLQQEREPGLAIPVSVVIPHYDADCLGYLGECLDGVAKTVAPDEVIIVDDCSNNVEDARQVIAKYSSALNIIPLYSQIKLYARGARQRGPEIAPGNVVVMHDADDIFHPQRIEFTRKFFQEHSTAAQLNSGHVSLVGRPLKYVRNFSEDEYASSIIEPIQIADALRGLFVWNRFSQGAHPDLHRAAYGCSA